VSGGGRSGAGAGPRFLSDASVRNLCIMPAIGLLIAFNVFPLLASLGISFTEYNPIIDHSPRFVGMENYRDLLDGPRQEVWKSFSRTGALVLVTVGLQTLIGFAVAMLLRRPFLGRGLFTAILLIPMMLSPAVMGSFWRYLFNADYGAINWFLDVRWNWDGSRALAFWAVAIAEVWMWTPFMMLLSLAGLTAIPRTLYEAAEVDRASRWFRFRHITLPLAAPMVLLGVVFRAMDTFRLFDSAMVLNGNLEGQPTTFVSVLLHARGFGGSRSLGEPTALAYLLLIASLALASLVLRYLDHVRGRRGSLRGVRT
jgi:multiple sugar transport system permease protein